MMASEESSKVDKRSLVVVGELPQDFLRIVPAKNPHTFDPTLWLNNEGCFNSAQNSIRLSITVGQAQLTKNYGLTRMDPYCRITIGRTVFETPTAVNGARNPVWNKVVLTAVPPEVSHVLLDIFDERAFMDDSRFAWTQITIPEKVFGGEQVNDWFPLSGKQGEHKEGAINLIFTLLSNPAEAMSLRSSKNQSPELVGTTPGTQTEPNDTNGNLSEVDPEEEKQRVASLKDMFPDVEEVVITSVLEANNWSMDQSINSLLDMQTT